VKKTKKVFIVNGRSGVGKDTLVNAVARVYRVQNISAVDRVKEIAKTAGWDGVKDDRGRQFLIDLKAAMVRYDDLPTRDLVKKYNDFLSSGDDILFIHIREPLEIQKLSEQIKCKTILVTRQNAPKFENPNDDNIFDYKYDLTFANDKPIEQSSMEFIIQVTNCKF
jgi:energy-coupling factor transporter ATP-binding protein EcfA2